MGNKKKYTKQGPSMIARHEREALQNLQVCYSGMDSGRVVLGDGTVTATSDHIMHIRGDCRVTAGMELALMVAIPNSDEHLNLVGGRVSSSGWDSFDVGLREVPESAREQLAALMQKHQAAPEDFGYAG